MTWLAETCMLSFGWRRALILLLAGAAAGLAMPPLFFLPLIFIAFPVWIWCLDGAEAAAGRWRLSGSAFAIGFFFGLGYFLVAIHWVGAAFFVDGGWLLAAMPFAALALAGLLALFWGLASAVAHRFWTHDAWRILMFATMLAIAEFARGHLFSGFPFDLLGYALTANDQMSQLASVIGVYGLTALCALIAPLPALIWPGEERSLARRLTPLFAVALVIAAQVGYGQYRLTAIDVTPREDVRFRLVQPAVDQALKWQADSRDFIMDRLLSLSEAKLTPDDPGMTGVTAVIWPESAMPFFLAEEPEELARIARMLPMGKYLITGAPRQDYGPGRPDGAFNAVMLINSDGEIVASYDKTHLVPFGEYLPFGGLLRQLGISQFVPGNAGWLPGDGRRRLSAPGLPAFLPLICYEILFSGDLGAEIANAGFILNLTNDGWFDGSTGPAQHFHHARLRAVEEGKPLIRAANTGISGFIDPLGRVSARIGAGEVGVLDMAPSAPLEPTFFARWRHWPLLAWLALCLSALTVHTLRRKRT